MPKMTLYLLEVRGQRVTIGSYDECRTIVQERWGWVPMAVAEATLKIKMTPVGVTELRAS